jgi:hypothetical protein
MTNRATIGFAHDHTCLGRHRCVMLLQKLWRHLQGTAKLFQIIWRGM